MRFSAVREYSSFQWFRSAIRWQRRSPRPLPSSEAFVVKNCSKILSTCDLVPEEVRQAVEQHHEEVSGVGYPRGSRGKDLPPLGRLLKVADLFCDFAIKNPDYPRGMSGPEAVDRMQQKRGDTLDPEFFGALKKVVIKV